MLLKLGYVVLHTACGSRTESGCIKTEEGREFHTPGVECNTCVFWKTKFNYMITQCLNHVGVFVERGVNISVLWYNPSIFVSLFSYVFEEKTHFVYTTWNFNILPSDNLITEPQVSTLLITNFITGLAPEPVSPDSQTLLALSSRCSSKSFSFKTLHALLIPPPTIHIKIVGISC